MPVYEYFCDDCNGVFEMLRPVRESSVAQPCPVCDAASRRLMPTEFAAYVYREGLPRRIPDTGKYWTAKGLSDKPETGGPSVEEMGLTYPWARKGFATSEDDDKEEWRQQRMAEQRLENLESGRLPEVDTRLADESNTYLQRKINTARIKKKLKTPTNAEVTPRTRSGDPGKPSIRIGITDARPGRTKKPKSS